MAGKERAELFGLLSGQSLSARDVDWAIARLGTVRLRHACNVLAFAPDGNTFATGGGDRTGVGEGARGGRAAGTAGRGVGVGTGVGTDTSGGSGFIGTASCVVSPAATVMARVTG